MNNHVDLCIKLGIADFENGICSKRLFYCATPCQHYLFQSSNLSYMFVDMHNVFLVALQGWLHVISFAYCYTYLWLECREFLECTMHFRFSHIFSVLLLEGVFLSLSA